ncbi:MAG: M4 family metallopeptidase [Dermatophilaceae bacterium]
MSEVHCQIVPSSTLRRLARQRGVSAEVRRALEDTLRIDAQFREVRAQANLLSQLAGPTIMRSAARPRPPVVSVFDCKNLKVLPGVQVTAPGTSSDVTAKTVYVETTKVAQFYKAAFKRRSIDDAGMALLSSVHYGVRYNNAFWNGSQMTYGDGDGSIFVDFSKGNDVIAHELTHGVTQHTLQLNYTDDAGGLNESLSDCFGSMFRQWQGSQSVDQADWLIGSDIMGPAAIQRGYTCLRDMANPAASHCLSAQPTAYGKLKPGMDPHESSGPPNLAFANACLAAGGKSWATVGRVWYHAMTSSGAQPDLTMPDFASMTRSSAATLFPSRPAIAAAVDSGWKSVGL